MKRPSILCYNDLNGEETAQVIVDEFTAVLADYPYFKPHLTFPRVRAIVHVELITEAEQPNAVPVVTIDREVDVRLSSYDPRLKYDTNHVEATFTIDSSPDPNTNGAYTKGNAPPDTIRVDHGIEPTIQVQTFSADGRKLSIGDIKPSAPNIESLPPIVQLSEPQNNQGLGIVVDRSGQSTVRRNATVITQDPGPAGLANSDGGSLNNRFRSVIKTGGNRADVPFLDPRRK